jgi:endoglucanase
MDSDSAPSARATRTHLALLRELTEAVAVSGDEGPLRAIVRREIEPFADSLRVDAMGNLLATRRGRGRKRLRAMVAAHMDEVGFMIMGADNEGLLRFQTVGHLDARQLLAKPVWVTRGRLPGVIGVKPIHLNDSDEHTQPVDIDTLRIDIGVESEEAARGKAKPGSWATFATRFTRLGPTVRAKALDDRLGVATLIELVRRPPAGVDLLAAFTVQEEVGLRGAQVAAFTLEPDAALVLDATPANDLPTWDGDENTLYNSRLGAGPAIYVADKQAMGDPRLRRLLLETAEAEGIRCQLRQPGGGTTDGSAIQLARAGIPTISLSVPARYTHTAASIASLDDWRGSVRLVHAALSRLRPSSLSLS